MIVRRFLSLSMVAAVLLSTDAARADATHDFILSCSYGVLAGTLVGAASLAFSDRPGDHLNSIARGASLGLYAGILLGLYVISLPEGDEVTKRPDFQMYPLVSSQRGLEGGAFNYAVYRF